MTKKQRSKGEKERLDRMYAGLMELFGMAKENVTDASTTIDEVLYGNYDAERQPENKAKKPISNPA